MRGLKSDPSQALCLAEKADVGKEGETVNGFTFHVYYFFLLSIFLHGF